MKISCGNPKKVNDDSSLTIDITLSDLNVNYIYKCKLRFHNEQLMFVACEHAILVKIIFYIYHYNN